MLYLFVSFVLRILLNGPLPFALAPSAPLLPLWCSPLMDWQAQGRSCKLKYMPHFCKQCVFVREIFF